MKNKYFILYTLLILSIIPSLSLGIVQNNANNAEVLLSSYFHYNIVNEVKKSASGITTDTNAKQQITETVEAWGENQKHNIRNELQDKFADDAKEVFSFFVKNYTTAEKSNDLDYLKTLASQLNMSSKITVYTDLRNIVITQWLQENINNAGSLLSELQTWNELTHKDGSTPPLKVWLDRDKNAPVQTKPTLATTEPDLPEFVEQDDEDGNSMDIYDKLQRKRRERVLKESQNFMKQIAEERKAAEEEYAQKKSAKATKEAAAVKAHAQKLAAAESETMEQRKHTWTARVSKLITSVAGGTFSAVTGGVGSAAGAAAAQAIFE